MKLQVSADETNGGSAGWLREVGYGLLWKMIISKKSDKEKRKEM
ncbi:hypothetical protein [Bacteroides intestinalis]|uniref:Uncharacterized protein n=1 Tax=Bacteroides intestinalis TaxID=329854 RepID=A0A139LT52_9BACE|nr:hypothetical protein [Bacteroides intestinalis]KXT54641.1 hypothetical protein HMPREF2531_00561 [Bacteroides intestinalis]